MDGQKKEIEQYKATIEQNERQSVVLQSKLEQVAKEYTNLTEKFQVFSSSFFLLLPSSSFFFLLLLPSSSFFLLFPSSSFFLLFPSSSFFLLFPSSSSFFLLLLYVCIFVQFIYSTHVNYTYPDRAIKTK